MKALTVWQPWASLIAIGAKPYEFRGWKAPKSVIGQRIAIHAGARPMKPAEVRALIWALKEREGTTNPCLVKDIAMPALTRILEGLKQEQDKANLFEGEQPFYLPRSHIVCTAIVGEPKPGDECASAFGWNAGNDSDREGTFNWGWPMLDIKVAEPPIPATGKQGLWDFYGLPEELK